MDKKRKNSLINSLLNTMEGIIADDSYKKKDEERIQIDNLNLPKNDIKLVADILLKRANFFHEKK